MKIPEEFNDKMDGFYENIIYLFIESYNRRHGDMLEMSVEEADEIFTEIIDAIVMNSVPNA